MHGGGSCEGAEEGDADTPELGLENVGGVFLVLGLGLFAAMVLGVSEFLWNVKTVAIEEKVSALLIDFTSQLYARLFQLDLTEGSLQGGDHVRFVYLDNNETGSRKRRIELFILLFFIVVEFIVQIQVLQALLTFQVFGHLQQESQELWRCGSFGA